MTQAQILEKYKDQRQCCELYSRVMGYFRPVHTWNIGKQGEFAERKLFVESKT
jgi:anaerobic ribonucleoside-triphosphate reductase